MNLSGNIKKIIASIREINFYKNESNKIFKECPKCKITFSNKGEYCNFCDTCLFKVIINFIIFFFMLKL